jgi:hypothetical protein
MFSPVKNNNILIIKLFLHPYIDLNPFRRNNMSRPSFADYAASRDEDFNEGAMDWLNSAKDFFSPAAATARDAMTTVSNKARQFATDYMGDVKKAKTSRALRAVAGEISKDLMSRIDKVARPVAVLAQSLKTAQDDMIEGFQAARAKLNDERFTGLIEPRNKSALNSIIKALGSEVQGVNQAMAAADKVVTDLSTKADRVRSKVSKILEDIAAGVDLQKVLGKVQAVDPVDTPMVQPSQSRLDPRRIGPSRLKKAN